MSLNHDDPINSTCGLTEQYHKLDHGEITTDTDNDISGLHFAIVTSLVFCYLIGETHS